MRKCISVLILLMLTFSFISNKLTSDINVNHTIESISSEVSFSNFSNFNDSENKTINSMVWPEHTKRSSQNYMDIYEYYGDGIYKISNIDFDFSYPQIIIKGNTMLIYENVYKNHDSYLNVVVYDISTGVVLAYNTFSDFVELSLLSENYIGVLDYSDYSVNVYNTKLEKIYNYDMSDEEYYLCWKISANGEYFVFCDDNILNVVELQGGKIIISKELLFKPTYCFNYKEAMYFTDYSISSPMYKFNTNTLELTEYGNGSYISNLTGIIERSNLTTDLVISPLEDLSVIAMLDLPMSISDNWSYNDGLIAMCEYSDFDENDNIYVIDIARSKIYNLKHSTVYISNIGDYLIFIDNEELYLWDFLSTDSETINIKFSNKDIAIKETEQLVKKIKNKYGITVFYNDDGNDFSSNGYIAKIVDDPFIILNAMQTIFDTLEIYPDGMIREMYVNDTENIDIYLSGKLSAVNSNGINTASGLTYKEMGTRAIVIDISNSLDEIKYTLFHELMHVTDDVLLEKENEVGLQYLSIWEVLIPKEFDYYWSYNDDDGNQISDYTYVMNNGDLTKSWFVDSYSTTFPTEDRARIFEYLMRGVLDGEEHSIKGEHLIYKAKYLCAVLRECFDCLKNVNELPWEAGLGKINIEDFKYLYH